MSWSDPLMDVVVAAVVGAVGTVFIGFVSLVVSYMKGYKDISSQIGKPENQSLTGFIEQKIGKLENQSLTGLIEQKAGKLDNTTLSGQNIEILKAVQNFRDEIAAEKKENNLKRGQLTGEQSKIEQSVAALSAFTKVMEDLQNKNSSLIQENFQLKHEIAQIKRQTEDIGQTPEETQAESSGFTQTLG